MIKIRVLIFMLLIAKLASAQINKKDLNKSWVLQKITYGDSSELPDENIIKYSYRKYSFASNGQMYISSIYYNRGAQFKFELRNNEIIQSQGGIIINHFQLEELTADKLVLLQSGTNGYKDPEALRCYFIAEEKLKASIPISRGDESYSLLGQDTIYKRSPKFYAGFQGESFQSYLKIGDGNLMHSKTGHFVASFIVFKSGKVDSLKIVKSISPEYDQLFIKEFNKNKKRWTPGKVDGVPVSVQMLHDVRYLNSDMGMQSFQFTNEANYWYKLKDYQKALVFLDKALDSYGFNQDNLYKRGICRKITGNLAGACTDWETIKSLGEATADVLADKYCK